MRHILLSILLFFLSIGVSWISVSAQSLSLSLKPAIHRIIARPDSSITIPITLTNYADPTLVRFEAYSFDPSLRSGKHTFAKLVDSDSSPTISFSYDDPFLILSKNIYDATYTIHIPQNTKEGDYYLAIFAKSYKNSGFVTSSSLNIEPLLGQSIYLSVAKNGEIRTDLSLVQIGLKNQQKIALWNGKILKIVDSSRPLEGSLTLVNKGIHGTQIVGKIQDNALEKTYIPSQGQIEIPFVPDWPYVGFMDLRVSIQPEYAAEISQSVRYVVLPFTYIGAASIALGGAGLMFLFLRKKNS